LLNLSMALPKTTLLCVLLSLLVCACGLKGPLYLPGETPPAADAGEVAEPEQDEATDEKDA
jgi:predicted small lipoprotein YifL